MNKRSIILFTFILDFLLNYLSYIILTLIKLTKIKKFGTKQGGCKTGDAVITTAGRLPAKFVIHTVGPVWNGGNKNEREKLASCYANSLRLAVENNCKTIAFPNISTGIYGYPLERATEIAVTTVREMIEQDRNIERVIFACFSEHALTVYQSLLGNP